LPKTPGLITGTGIRTGHLAAIAVYAVLVILVGVAMNLGALATSMVVLLPIVVIIVLLIASRASSTGSDRRFETTGATTTAEFPPQLLPIPSKRLSRATSRVIDDLNCSVKTRQHY
jgi:hypothetical protein